MSSCLNASQLVISALVLQKLLRWSDSATRSKRLLVGIYGYNAVLNVPRNHEVITLAHTLDGLDDLGLIILDDFDPFQVLVYILRSVPRSEGKLRTNLRYPTRNTI